MRYWRAERARAVIGTRERCTDRAPLLAGGLALGLGALLAVHFLLRGTYWDYSEGVYALTAHLMLHGHSLYRQVVGAQPPGVFLVGTGLLAIHDSLEWLRLGVAALQLCAGLIAAEIVRRLTASRLATVLTPAAVLLTPWAVHEHGALTPELVALPVLMAAVLTSVEERRAPLSGLLCGLAPLIKVPFAIPALVVVACSAAPRRTAGWALATAAVGAGATTAIAGTAAWRDAVYAQSQSGYRSLGVLKGFWAQAGWNLVGLAIPATVALRYRAAARDPRLLRVSAGFAVAMIVTFLTNVKQGTGLNITVPVELALLPLAACGTTLALRAARRSARAPAVACLAGAAFVLAQSGSLLASPRHPQPFLRLGSKPAWGMVLSADGVRAAVAVADRCPSSAAYTGPPLIALLAGRRMPDDQPDQFITAHAATLRGVARRIVAVRPLCP
jgi:hypothetical protein